MRRDAWVEIPKAAGRSHSNAGRERCGGSIDFDAAVFGGERVVRNGKEGAGYRVIGRVQRIVRAITCRQGVDVARCTSVRIHQAAVQGLWWILVPRREVQTRGRVVGDVGD